MYKIQIEHDNEWRDYIKVKPKINNCEISIRASYYGSSTRVSEIGEVHNQNGTHDKNIRVLDNNDSVICTFYLSKHHLNGVFYPSDNKIIPYPLRVFLEDKDNNIKGLVHFRDLHRWPGYPSEISGIKINLKNTIN